jgi:hypothetical protein
MKPHKSAETLIISNTNFNEVDWFMIIIVFLGIYLHLLQSATIFQLLLAATFYVYLFLLITMVVIELIDFIVFSAYNLNMVFNIIITIAIQIVQPNLSTKTNIYYDNQHMANYFCMDYFYSRFQSAPLSHDIAAMFSVINLFYTITFVILGCIIYLVFIWYNKTKTNATTTSQPIIKYNNKKKDKNIYMYSYIIIYEFESNFYHNLLIFIYLQFKSAPLSHDYAAMSNVININFILWFNLISFLYIYIIISNICARIDQILYINNIINK